MAALPIVLRNTPDGNRGPGLVGFLIGFTMVALLFVGLRLGIRIHKRLIGWDDYAIIVAMVFSIMQTITGSLAVHYGYGKHITDISRPDLKVALFYFYLTQIWYKCVTWPCKASILLMYQRIFGDTPDVRAYGIRFRTSLYFMMAVVVAGFLASELVGIFACLPVQRSWDHSVPGSCILTTPWWFSYSAINISTDIVILALPMPLISGLLQVTKRQKLGLMAVFALGGFVCVCTIVRMTTLKTGSTAKDTTWYGVTTLEWTAVETNVGIICACLPLLRPLINHCIPWFAQRTTRGTHSGPAYNHRNQYGSGKQVTHSQRNDSSWDKWGKSSNIVMSKVSTRLSRTSSEAAITEYDGIKKQVDFSTSVETTSDREDYPRAEPHAL